MKTCASLFLALTVAASTAVAAAPASPLPMKVLSELDRFEPWEGQIFHADRLWVGRSRKDLGAHYRLELFAADGAKVLEKALTHSLRYIYPYDARSVLVTGLGTDGLSHYTIARLDAAGTSVSLEHVVIPMDGLASRWAGKPGAMYFTDPGGFDDPDNPTDPSQPLQTVFTLTRAGRVRWLAPHIAGPTLPLLIEDKLYLMSAPSIYSGGKSLHKIDPATGEDTILVDDRERVVDLIRFPSLNLLAMAEAGAKRVTTVDLKTGRGEELAITDGTPRTLAAYGKCLLVGLEDTKLVHVFDLTAAEHAKPIQTWDLSGAGAKFLQLRGLAADPASGRLYARSAYACSPVEACDPDRNSAVMAEPGADDLAVRQCLGL